MPLRCDKHGEYQVDDSWVHAWEGGGPYVAGWTRCELRRYEDGVLRVHRGEPQYCREHTAAVATMQAVPGLAHVLATGQHVLGAQLIGPPHAPQPPAKEEQDGHQA